MATPETLREDDLQTLPQDLTDQEAQTVTFTPDSAEGKEYYNFPSEKIKEMKDAIEEALMEIVEDLKDTETVKGWEWAEKFVDELENDFRNLALNDSTINLLLALESIGDDNKEGNNIPEEAVEKVAIDFIKLLDEANDLILKYVNKLNDMLTSGLENNFQDIPEPTKSKYIRDRKDIVGVVNDLRNVTTLCNNISEILKGKADPSEINGGLLDETVDELADLFEEIEDVLFIEDIEISFKELGREVENRISSKNGRLDWGKERGHIEFDDDKYVIKSWGKEVKVESLYWNGVNLEGLNLHLDAEDGIWLANFKNWIKYKYGDKKISLEGTDYPTFYQGRTKLIDVESFKENFDIRKYTNNHFPIIFNKDGKRIISQEERNVMEKICEWLNK